ncbi:MAG: hypothetical protein HW420_1334, partial [Candidatus Nitrosotenuis sp.]|nr:hypothetical protein [Candidatus Nitrosotenuis sp.]
MAINHYALCSLVAIIFVIGFSAIHGEQTGSIELEVKNDAGDRLPEKDISLKIFKDFEKTPLLEIPSLPSNPYLISSLPIGHKYKIEVYMNSMYGDIDYVDLQKSQQHFDFTIPNAGGMRLTIFYNDGQTPLVNSQVTLKSHDNKIWGYSTTDTNGQTNRFWIQPVGKDTDYYFAEISLDPNLKFRSEPIKLQPITSQEFKIVTKWPNVIDKSITIEVYNNTKNKTSKSDGMFAAVLTDSKKNKVSESPVSNKGLAYFSNLKVGTYRLLILEKISQGEQIKTVAEKNIVLNGPEDIFKVYIHNPELNTDHLNCNCVAFRLDDIQDYFLNNAQMDMIKLFKQQNASLTLGVIASPFGTDPKLVDLIKDELARDENYLEIANHSWSHRVMTSLTKTQQGDDIAKSNKKINDVLGVKPITFIPPENLFNNDTLSVLQENNFTHISYHIKTANPPLFKKSDFYHFPAASQTSILQLEESSWKIESIDKTLDAIHDSIFNYGYAVVMMHPHEFSLYSDGSYQNKVNQTQIEQLSLLIDKIKKENLKIVLIKEIENFDKPQLTKNTQNKTKPIEQKTEIPNCNCIAFRMDNIQDFYLNDVQNAAISKFGEKNVPLTISIIGQFFGNDPKAINLIKEKIQSETPLRIANRGWEYVDHAIYDKEKQAASIKKTNEKIFQVLQVKPATFTPPLDSFNKNTIEAVNQNKMHYFSASITRDPPPYTNSLKHVPSTALFVNLLDDDPFYSGTIPQKALAKIKSNISQYGYAVISLQSQDFAAKDGK